MPCSAGYFCQYGTTETSCPSGTYSLYSTGGTYACTDVPAGYGFVAADHPPHQCPPGFYQDQNQDSGGCIICPIGYECPGGSSAYLRPIYCDHGTYSPIEGISSCIPCPQGFYCSDPSAFPVFCPDGTYSNDGQSECTLCPAGMQCIGGTQDAIAICDDGYYSGYGD